MPRSAVAAGLAAVLVSTLSGCGTALNLTERPVFHDYYTGVEQRSVYGGTQSDLKVGAMCVAAPFVGLPEPDRASDAAGFVFGAGVLLLDLPLSVVGDTLTLPYTLYVNAQRRRAGDSDAAPARIATQE